MSGTLTAGPHTVEASDLGLRAGSWPVLLHHVGQVWKRTSALHDPDGDLVYVRYVTRNGLTMLVYND